MNFLDGFIVNDKAHQLEIIKIIRLTPQHAKRLAKALHENVKRFEKAHGEIKDYEQPPWITIIFVILFKCSWYSLLYEFHFFEIAMFNHPSINPSINIL